MNVIGITSGIGSMLVGAKKLGMKILRNLNVGEKMNLRINRLVIE